MSEARIGLVVMARSGLGVLHELTGVIAKHRGDILSVEIIEEKPPDSRIYFEIDLPVAPVSRRTIERIAAFASSVVASIAIRWPFSSPRSASTPNTQPNTSRCVSTSISRRVREIVE